MVIKHCRPPPDDVRAISIDVEVGESIHLYDEHGLALSPPFPTTTLEALDSGPLLPMHWAPSTVGYLPPSTELRVDIITPARATFACLPPRIFQSAAFETIDVSSLELRYLPALNTPVAANLIAALAKMSEDGDPNHWPMIGEAIGTALAVKMMRHLGARHRAAAVPYPGGLSTEKLRLVIEYIEDNISKQIRLAELAGVAQLSMYHFSRSFRAAMNIAPVNYVWRRRIERAKDALRNTKTPLVVIAYDCGFSSQSHFATAFKKSVGMTPAAFRLALRITVPAAAARLLVDGWVQLMEMAALM